MLTKIISSFEAQYKILSYRIDLYFHDCKLAIEVDKKVDNDRNIDYEIKRKNQ